MLPLPAILALSLLHYNGREFELFGIRLIGFNGATGKKLLFTLVLIVGLWFASWLLRTFVRLILSGGQNQRAAFWVRQAIRLLASIIFIIGLISIWFSNPGNLTTFIGLVTAGIAFALQRVITAIAGYIVILHGRTFNVGDRIVMGGVRGDVIDLSLIQTRIMEMGEPPATQEADPAVWVRARQYTGRIVTITNDKIFDNPVFNYTKEFPYIWEEMSLPINYKDDRHRAEEVLLEVAHKHTVDISEMSEDAIREMERRYVMRRHDIRPRVYWRITDNWLELTVRFLTHESGVRDIKDAMSRDILAAFDEARIGIASSTYDIVGMPPLHLIHEPPAPLMPSQTPARSPS